MASSSDANLNEPDELFNIDNNVNDRNTRVIYKQYPDLPESSSEDEDDKFKDKSRQATLREAFWFRPLVPRKTGDRTDVYYFEFYKSECLMSLNEIQKYCDKHGISYNPNPFNFSSKDKSKVL